ncbi:hypothetical protein [Limnobacter sp.]|uniref:hypothetical protein n=1 Tax=Limnobacter sp. TaxID=2003368 RepID=UPI00273419E1|nr:hypothetical protein [Limnobacter sp.]MDP3187550.1 hypothetical protein [Limnobacter sp.]
MDSITNRAMNKKISKYGVQPVERPKILANKTLDRSGSVGLNSLTQEITNADQHQKK